MIKSFTIEIPRIRSLSFWKWVILHICIFYIDFLFVFPLILNKFSFESVRPYKAL